MISVVILAAAGLLIIGQLQLRRALKRNRELSEIDALTGVANVRRLIARIEEEEVARERGGDDGHFALIVLDLDDFKAVNDTLGHSTGDRVLAEVARAIERELEPSDPLTGLANVRRMNRRLVDELDRARSLGGYVTIFMIDLDDFKQVNDRHGHGTGDRTLVAAGKAIAVHMRAYDLVARRGGDEFVAIAQHDGELDLVQIAGRIANEIGAARAAICPDSNPQASVGWVTSRRGDTAAELIARADTSEKDVKQSHRLDAPARFSLREIA